MINLEQNTPRFAGKIEFFHLVAIMQQLVSQQSFGSQNWGVRKPNSLASTYLLISPLMFAATRLKRV